MSFWETNLYINKVEKYTSKMEAKACIDRNIMYIISFDIRVKCLNIRVLLTVTAKLSSQIQGRILSTS